jgi:hypothetical protein
VRPISAGESALKRLDQLCRDVGSTTASAEVGRSVEDLRVSLHEPLRLAVVGRVKAGKSTLVNALVGRRVAPTRAGECTRIVTWYRYGSPDRAYLESADGARRDVPLVAGALPEDVEGGIQAGSRLIVHLQAGALRDLTLIDTPGLDSLTTENDAATRNAILGAAESTAAAGQADALLYVVRDSARAGDRDFVRTFRETAGLTGVSALSAVGVVAQADVFGAPDRDPMTQADVYAQQLAQGSSADLSAVVALSGLLAQTARTGQVDEDVARQLAALGTLDPRLLRVWRQVQLPSGLQSEQVQRLFTLFGPYGVAGGGHVAAQGARALRSWCEEASGLRALESVVRDRMLPRTRLIKAARCLRALEALSDGESGRSLVEQARLDPALHLLHEMDALEALRAGASDSVLLKRLQQVASDTSDALRVGLPADAPATDVAAAARRGNAAAMSELALAVNRSEAEAARVLARSYQLIARRATVTTLDRSPV